MTKTIRNFYSTNPESLKTAAHDDIVTAFAVIQVMESMLYYDMQEKDSRKDPIMMAELKRIKDRNSAIIRLYFKRFRDRCFCVNYSGCLSDDDDRSHYDIDDALEAKFGDAVSVDSESGMFCAFSTESMKDDITKFLHAEFPTLEFDAEVEDDVNDTPTEHYREPRLRMGWTGAEEWLKDHEVEVDYVLPTPSPKTGKELMQLLQEARTALFKTGLPKEEAIKLL